MFCGQNGGECLRAFASVATEQLVAFRDDFGKSFPTLQKASFFVGPVSCLVRAFSIHCDLFHSFLFEVSEEKKMTGLFRRGNLPTPKGNLQF